MLSVIVVAVHTLEGTGSTPPASGTWSPENLELIMGEKGEGIGEVHQQCADVLCCVMITTRWRPRDVLETCGCSAGFDGC